MKGLDSKLIITIVGAGLALVATLLMFLVKNLFSNIKDSINNLSEATTKRLDSHEENIRQLMKDFNSLKESLYARSANSQKDWAVQLTDIEKELHALQTKILSDNVTKSECRDSMADMKERFQKLEKAIREVDKVSREQALLLIRIEGTIQAILDA